MASHAIIATMRNEAVTLIEWLAHHLAVGFDHFFICTNDCQDGTDEILELLSPHFPICHRDNPPPYADTIQKQALHLARQDKIVSASDWCLHIDADEYVNVLVGGRRIADLTALHPNAHAVALMWKFLGNSGVTHWSPGRILDQFTLAEGEMSVERMNFKTIFRPSAFKRFSVHNPKLPRDPDALVVVNTAGIAMPVDTILRNRGSGYPPDLAYASWENARLHHYHVKPDDLHRAKHARGDANGRRNRKRKIGSDYYHQVNCNDAPDSSMSFYRSASCDIEAAMRAVPGVAEAERRAIAWLKSSYSL